MVHICKKCDAVFRDITSLKKHLSKKFPCDEVSTCQYCNKTCENNLKLETHQKSKACQKVQQRLLKS